MSNKIPKASSSKKTAWARRHWRLLVGLVVLLIVLFGCVLTARAPETNTLIIRGHQFIYEAADTSAEQEKGLGDRSSLASNHAMLFWFTQPGRQCFWMKDMRFNLDIIWLTSDKKVVHIEPDLSPATYPRSYCADNTQYVVEVNAGTMQQLGAKTGDTVHF